jgi:ABC-type amino acid transport substrate-binding protein
MKWFLRLLLAVALWVGAFIAGHADQLDNIRTAGVLGVAVSDGNPPFSFVDPLSRTIIGSTSTSHLRSPPALVSRFSLSWQR